MGDDAELARRSWAVVKSTLASGGCSAAQLSLRVGDRSWSGAIGSDARGGSATARTWFHWTCAAKPVVAVAVGRLVEQGRWDLDAPLREHLGDLGGSPVAGLTAVELLTHSAHLAADAARPVAAEDPDATLARIAAAGTVPLAPGHAHYSAWAGWFLLGRVIAALTGLAPCTYAEREVLAPLGVGARLCAEPGAGDGARARLRADGAEPVFLDDPGGLPCLPGVSGRGTAAALGAVFDLLADPGRHGSAAPVIAPSTAELLRTPHRTAVWDEARGNDLAWGLGLVVDRRAVGTKLSPATFSHAGDGGVIVAFADPERDATAVVAYDRMLSGRAGVVRQLKTTGALVRDVLDAAGDTLP